MNSVPSLVCKIPGPSDWTTWLDGFEAAAMMLIAIGIFFLATRK